MLVEKTIREQYKIIDKKIYAVFNEIEKRRELKGCDVRAELQNTILNKQNELEQVKVKEKNIQSDLAELFALDSTLASLGYCKKDNVIYKKVDGILIKGENGQPIITGHTHSEYCTHRED